MERTTEMALFKRQASQSVRMVETDLTEEWFLAWGEDVCQRGDFPHTPDWLMESWGKCAGVIDHDCRDYVGRYCEAWTMPLYDAYYRSDEMTPWGLVSFVCGCNPGDDWRDFIVGDMKEKLTRFGDIMVDSSIAE
jgi:hypothetical protein